MIVLSRTHPIFEALPHMTIHRINVSNYGRGITGQLPSLFLYARGVAILLRNMECDLIIATTSRLMTGTLGAYFSMKFKCLLYLDIRDIFVDSVKLILPWILKLALLPFLEALERYTIKSANRINLVSEGFSPYFTERYQVKNFDLFTNGIDDEFLNINFKNHLGIKANTHCCLCRKYRRWPGTTQNCARISRTV